MKLPKFLPDSLALRTVLLVIAIIAVAEITTFSMIFRHDRLMHMRQTVRYVAGQVRLLQKLLPGLDDELRLRLEETAPEEQWLQLRPDGGNVPQRVPEFGFAAMLAKELGRSLGGPIDLRYSGHGMHNGLWIGFQADGERWWLILPPPRFKPQELPPGLWQKLGGALLVLILIAGWFVHGIIRPLKRLSEAVSATGEGTSRQVTPSGPVEVRRLAERYNNMLTQLAHADSERNEMLAGLTHDLRAPLARLRVRLALLENEADRIGFTRDADDMERIVTQCLAFLRSETQPAGDIEALAIADVVSNEVARHRELGRSLEISVSAPVAACLVAVTRGDLQRLLDNLIDNALQYGAPPVEVALAVERPGTITLRVRDHGPGIADADKAKALEAFAQIEPARATRGSCGLGLAIVRRIVEGYGGELSLSNAPDGGLQVAITLEIRH